MCSYAKCGEPQPKQIFGNFVPSSQSQNFHRISWMRVIFLQPIINSVSTNHSETTLEKTRYGS